MTFANRLEKILQELERETFQHLQLRFPHFLASPEYVFLVAQEKADESKKVRSYRSYQTFIEFVKDNNESPFLHGLSVDDISHFDFSAHEGDLKETLRGKLFIHHGDEFSLHMNKFGSFHCRDSNSDEETDRALDHNPVLRPLVIPDRGSNAVNDAEDLIRLEGEALCDLYPSLAPALALAPAPVPAALSIPSAPLPSIPCNGNGNTNIEIGNNKVVLIGKDNNINNRRRASVRISRAWDLGSDPDPDPYTEIKVLEQFKPLVVPEADILNKREEEEINKKALHVPYMLASLSSRFCLQLSMLLCSNM